MSAIDDNPPPQSSPPGARPRRRGLWLVLAVVLLVVVTAGIWLYSSMWVFEVVPGTVFRSRQLKPDELRKVAVRHRIRTVINLRSNNPDNEWLSDEQAVCSQLGIAHGTATFMMGEWPPRHQVRKLVDLLDFADPPILIHCFRGVDRSGWASTVAQLMAGVSLDDALAQLSPRFGHICDANACPLHLFFASYRKHLDSSAVPENPTVFRDWVTEDYCPEPYNARLTLLSDLPEQVAPRQPMRASVRAVNQGPVSWRMTDLETTGVRLGGRIIGPYETPPADAIDILRTPNGPAVDLSRAGLEFGVMAPAAERDFELRFRAPAAPGWYVLQIDMVDELVHWFSDLGFPGILHELHVVEPETGDPS